MRTGPVGDKGGFVGRGRTSIVVGFLLEKEAFVVN